MTDAVFGEVYSHSYDSLYQDKDYEVECDVLEKIFRSYRTHPVGSVLDLGCGTGNHSIPLALRGYRVTGVDRSEAMLSHARGKAAASGADACFLEEDIRTANLGTRFDAVLMMFAVLGYQIENEDVAQTLSTVRRHLEPGGLFVFDLWYGPTVLKERPSTQFKTVPVPGGSILRAATGDLDTGRHTCTVRYHLWHIEDGRVMKETEEVHEMRYFFPKELEYYLSAANMELVHLSAFPDLTKKPDDTVWNVLGAAKALP